jgi:hypothetical protein
MSKKSSEIKSHFTKVPQGLLGLNLNHTQLKVILFLLQWHDSTTSYFGQAYLARQADCSVAAVKRALSELEHEHKIIEVERARTNSKKTNRYVVLVERINRYCTMPKEQAALEKAQLALSVKKSEVIRLESDIKKAGGVVQPVHDFLAPSSGASV